MEEVENSAMDRIPVAHRFPANFHINGLPVIEEVRAAIEDAGLVLDRPPLTQS